MSIACQCNSRQFTQPDFRVTHNIVSVRNISVIALRYETVYQLNSLLLLLGYFLKV